MNHNNHTTQTATETETELAEPRTLHQLEGMLSDLINFRDRVVNEKLNMDVRIVDDDIVAIRERVYDKKKMLRSVEEDVI